MTPASILAAIVKVAVVLQLLALSGLQQTFAAALPEAGAAPSLDAYNVIWQTPSADVAGSMPLGNGDIGVNVWVEKDGDLLFYISKTDAWSDDYPGPYSLPKLGLVHVKLKPNPFAQGSAFRQTLELQKGQIVIDAGTESSRVTFTLWVDANNPVIHLQWNSTDPLDVDVSAELRKTSTGELHADHIFAGQADRIAWCYRDEARDAAASDAITSDTLATARDERSRNSALKNLTFRAVIRGRGLVSAGETMLHSAQPQRDGDLAIYVQTSRAKSEDDWLAQLDQRIAVIAQEDPTKARQRHLDWWRDFWNRSWIVLDGDDAARTITRGYLLQRFMSACAGRGDFPIKFNGSIFTAGGVTTEQDAAGKPTTRKVNADYRVWGGDYWMQNTRHLYWPMLQAGDFDMMQPLFRMYRAMLPVNLQDVKNFYGHGGAYFAETTPFYGGLPHLTADTPGLYVRHYYTPILELSAMMLDYYTYTGDRAFAQGTLLPIANAGLTFFDEHFGRDQNGKLLLDPDNAAETYWKVQNPMPDIAGLHDVLQRLLALPPELTDAKMRQNWQRIFDELPPLPISPKDGDRLLLPFETFGQDRAIHNSENPELYAIFPFRLFGVGRPELQLALDTFAARRFKGTGCWQPDAIQAALLGDAELAAKDVLANFQRNSQYRFPAMWDGGSDYPPDEDNGGVAENALQLMALQSIGRRLLLLPAWPPDWSGSFKLHAPLSTTLQATVRNGNLTALTVTPSERKQDVEIRQKDGSFAKIGQ